MAVVRCDPGSPSQKAKRVHQHDEYESVNNLPSVPADLGHAYLARAQLRMISGDRNPILRWLPGKRTFPIVSEVFPNPGVHW